MALSTTIKNWLNFNIFNRFNLYIETLTSEKREWNEQHLVQVLLETSKSFEVLWPGHFLQRTQKDFGSYFDNVDNRSAQSLWLRKV
jgi:hypothetical protein